MFKLIAATHSAIMLLAHCFTAVRGANRGTPLHEAVTYGRILAITVLIQVDASQLQATDRHGDTPVIISVSRQPQSFQALLKLVPSSFDVASYRAGYTAVHYAARFASPDVLLAFLGSSQPWMLMTRNGVGGETPIHVACRYQDASGIQMLLQGYPRGFDIRCDNGDSPVHVALESGKGTPELIRAMWEALPGCFDGCNRRRATPVHAAARCASAEALSTLLQLHPVGFLARTNGGETPMHVACRYRSVDIVTVLLNGYPAAFRVPCHKQGDSAVHVLLETTKTTEELMRQLLRIMPDCLNLRNQHQATPLHGGARHASLDVLRVVMKVCPAALEARDEADRTPWQVMESHGRRGAINMLRGTAP